MDDFYKIEPRALTQKEIQAGSIKGLYPVYIESLHATFYVKKKLTGNKLKSYIKTKLIQLSENRRFYS